MAGRLVWSAISHIVTLSPHQLKPPLFHPMSLSTHPIPPYQPTLNPPLFYPFPTPKPPTTHPCPCLAHPFLTTGHGLAKFIMYNNEHLTALDVSANSMGTAGRSPYHHPNPSHLISPYHKLTSPYYNTNLILPQPNLI